MRRNYQKSIFMFLICLVGMFCSCSKDAYSGNEDEAANNTVVWDDEAFKVSYAKVPLVFSTPGPLYNIYFDLRISLDNSEDPSKYIDVSLVNYEYGEKVDLTTNKFESQFTIVDEAQKPKVDFDVKGGSSHMNQGSYFLMSRDGDEFTIDMQICYTNNSGFSHSIKVKYKGTIIGSDGLPPTDWKEILKNTYTYKFDFNGESCKYGSLPVFSVGDNEVCFRADLYGKVSSFYVWATNFEYGKQIPIIAAQIQEDRQNTSELLWKDAILDGSYILVNKNANQLGHNDIIVKLNCKKDDKLYKFDVEYKGELKNGN